ncbi:MAG TPA: dihydrolipoamide acetyltransferase family protein [Cellulomonas sp.]|uniref:dihydrolipoamide acetyltransferase family protein n=1 Tax=Cellulomonas sp. TaxID=40001 RepID=UPI002E30E2A1|nr:dihydrolipoamide acetyltransferase family protein [Cellulomonas sp.]HEX5332261.1 dihydrolipoamide acetyltransferase family protein [Cellulomonas sp.]
MAEFRMPSLGADMDSGTLIAWRMAVGDHVARGDIVAEVDTDKSVIDVETFTTGTVEELLVTEGARVPVGTPLAVIREDAVAGGEAAEHRPGPGLGAATTEGAAPSAVAPGAPAPPPVAPQPAAPVSAPAPTPAPLAGARRPLASPLARRHAAALGIDLASVVGTGPDGAVTTSDVDHAAAAHRAGRAESPAPAGVPATSPTEGPVAAAAEQPAPQPLSKAERQAAVRRAVGASMARSKREIPHYYLASDIDLARAVHWLDDRNAAVPVTERMLPAVLLLKATALALRETPDLNGFWEQGQFRPADGVHVGVAIALRGGGLVAPALHDTDHLTLTELMTGLRDLVARARAGRLRSSEASEPTITVTSLGDQGVDVVQPVIYPPQVAIVGFGRIRPRPWAVDGMLGVRPVVTATLAADHRVSDGHRGAVFLTALDRLLQAPEEL